MSRYFDTWKSLPGYEYCRTSGESNDGRVNRGKGADQGSGTRSSLMWETIHIIQQMGNWKPKWVIWENVRNVMSRHMIANFSRYQEEMEDMGYTNNYEVLDAREFGLPQARERVFTVSSLGKEKFCFDDLIRTPMRNISEFLENNEKVPEVYDVTQPSVRNVIGVTGSVRRATVHNYHTTRQNTCTGDRLWKWKIQILNGTRMLEIAGIYRRRF